MSFSFIFHVVVCGLCSDVPCGDESNKRGDEGSEDEIERESCSKAVDVYAFAVFVSSCFGPIPKLDNQWTIQPNPAPLMRKIAAEGQRPIRPPKISAAYWEFVEKCWIRAPEDRPTFDNIVWVMKSRYNQLSICGTHLQNCAAYLLKVGAGDIKRDSRPHKSNREFIKQF
jgi:hypothetical protein